VPEYFFGRHLQQPLVSDEKSASSFRAPFRVLRTLVLSVRLLFAVLGESTKGQEKLHQSIKSGTWQSPENGMIMWLL
jgi:hypothetical protein